ncbi:hypothetical protein [Streptomyces sp. NPDC005303]|uniref:hypothetical protein n=1 Tax=Streptomyces sp. NPDC005303 TaxID=3155713 RepID=UPI0033BBCE8C
MTVLPEPPATTAGQATRDATIDQAADQMLAALNAAVQREKQPPTRVRVDDDSIPSYEDGPRAGDTPPVTQPDSRIVPQWATGLAVASIGVGAGATGLGCAAWLFFKGLSMVSVPGLERFAWIIIAPFAGAAMLATAIGGLISKAKKAAMPEVHNHNYSGPVRQDTRIDQRRAVWQKDVDKSRN